MRLFIAALLLSTSIISYADNNDNIIEQAQQLLKNGQYYLAVDNLNALQAKPISEAQQVRVEGLLGLTYYRMHRYEQADKLLTKVINSPLATNHDKAHWTAALADSMLQHAKTNDARRLYSQALLLAKGDTKLTLGIRLEQTALLNATEQLTQLEIINKDINTLPIAERLAYWLNIASKAAYLGDKGIALAYSCFEQVQKNATGQEQTRLLAQALAGLAQLYETQKRFEEALQLNNQALATAQTIEVSELLIDLHWRQARLNRALHNNEAALLAYQHAIEKIEAIRQDIPVEYHNGRSSFRETLEPIYLGLADLLLQKASGQQGELKTQTLRKARETVELIKQSEVEDFLGGRCGIERDEGALLETIAQDTTILYPILLPERLELLVSNGTEIRQYTQKVNAKTLRSVVQDMIKNLHQGGDAKLAGKQLHHWLIEPFEPWLQQQNVQNLVIVPDNVLRTLPLAALYDGKQYLIERYAVASSAGLAVMKPQPMQHHKVNALLAGLSKPGTVIEHLPVNFLSEIATLKGYNTRELSETADNAQRSIELEKLMRQANFQQHVKDKLNLPAVAQEIETVSKQLPNTVLMNEQFTVTQFTQQIMNEPYAIVHIASHGVFGKTAASSFVMAYDNVIDMNLLESLFNTEKLKKQPIELLALNACETAEGDDRTPLGLSGVAIKTNVKSALGTLWSVSDDASYQIMTTFYKTLSEDKTSKVKALQQAQLSLLRNPDFKAPVFWASFILVGNWL